MKLEKLNNSELKQLNGGSNSWWDNARNKAWETAGKTAGRMVKVNGQSARAINKGYSFGTSPLK